MTYAGFVEDGLTTGDNELDFKIGDNKVVEEISISAPGIQGDVEIILFDDEVSEDQPITNDKEPIMLAALNTPIKLNYVLKSDKIGMELSGRTGGTEKVFVNIKYAAGPNSRS